MHYHGVDEGSLETCGAPPLSSTPPRVCSYRSFLATTPEGPHHAASVEDFADRLVCGSDYC
jgi:hypothetical protein